MKSAKELLGRVEAGEFDSTFALLYPRESAMDCRKRYSSAIKRFEELYGAKDALLVSAPGRTEVGGNHTDHQRGRVLAAAVGLAIVCVAAPNGEEDIICIQSEGYPQDVVSLHDLSPQGSKNSSSLIRGAAEWLTLRGHTVGGFDAYTTSREWGGSGLSSSAAFEVAVGQMLNHLFNGGQISPTEIALGGQYVENHHFGKPSGLMDQMASAVGGFVGIDFEDPAQSQVSPVNARITCHRLCIVDTKGSHADLTPDYAAIPAEMGQVAAFFDKECLRQVEEEYFWNELPRIRQAAGDRAVLRAIHFFRENPLHRTG